MNYLFPRSSVAEALYKAMPIHQGLPEIISEFAGPPRQTRCEQIVDWVKDHKMELLKNAVSAILMGAAFYYVVAKTNADIAATENRYTSYITLMNTSKPELSSLLEQTCASIFSFWNMGLGGLVGLQYHPPYDRKPMECDATLQTTGFYQWGKALNTICQTAQCKGHEIFGRIKVLASIPMSIIPSKFRDFIYCKKEHDNQETCEAVVNVNIGPNSGSCKSEIRK